MKNRIIQNVKRYIVLSMLGMAFFVMSLLSLYPGKNTPITAYANGMTSLDTSNVESDFTQAQMDKIELEYTNCNKSNLYVISFVEYCFPYDINYSGNFGLYIYVYNPSGKSVVENSTLHEINIRINDFKGEKEYVTYSLKLCSISSNGKFIKFRIIDRSSSSGGTILTTLHENKLQRVYDVSELEIQHEYNKNAVAYTVGKKYTYTGFAKGYGQDSTKESTVDVHIENLTVIPRREVHHTSWRPEGTNGEDDTQDLLASVYFTLPNTIRNEQGEEVNVKETYGNLYGVHAQWLEAITKPMLITGTEEVYNALSDWVGIDISQYYDTTHYSKEVAYGFISDYETTNLGGGPLYHSGDLLYNIENTNIMATAINTLYWLFPCVETGVNLADSYTLPSEEIQTYAREYSDEHTLSWINGTNYSRDLFEYWDNSFTEVTYYANEKKTLTSETFEGFLGFFGKPTEKEYNVPVIQEVTKCTNAWQVETDYYVNQNDFEEFKETFNEENTTLYVFHFAVDDYKSAEVTQFYPRETIFGVQQAQLDTNAFLAQETVYLNFDIIDVTLMDDNGTQTVFGFVANPIDIFPDATPPVDTTTDIVLDFSELTFYLRLLAGLIIGGLLLAVLALIFPPILSALLFIISLPFKLLGMLFGNGEG